MFLVCNQLFNMFYGIVSVTSCFWWFYPFCLVQFTRLYIINLFMPSVTIFFGQCFWFFDCFFLSISCFFVVFWSTNLIIFTQHIFGTNFFVFAWPYFYTHIILFTTSNMSKKVLKSRKTKCANVLFIWNDGRRRLQANLRLILFLACYLL